MRRIAPPFARLALGAALAAGAQAAFAEDFEFEVPVQLSKIDSAFTQGKVTCQVRGIGRDGGGQATSPNALVASGDATFALVQGGFNGAVSVRFNAGRPQHEPQDGRTWNCALSLVSAGGAVSACSMDLMSGQATGRVPEILKLDPKTVKACAQGTITTGK
jgi:hypothetical protein